MGHSCCACAGTADDEVVESTTEGQCAEFGDVGGSGLPPAHARPPQAGSDDLFAGTLDEAAADRIALRSIARIGHAMPVVAEVSEVVREDFARVRTTPAQPVELCVKLSQQSSDLAFEESACSACQIVVCFCFHEVISCQTSSSQCLQKILT